MHDDRREGTDLANATRGPENNWILGQHYNRREGGVSEKGNSPALTMMEELVMGRWN